jgi:hypothetical protein
VCVIKRENNFLMAANRDRATLNTDSKQQQQSTPYVISSILIG